MEQVLFRLHVRLTTVACNNLSQDVRKAVEYSTLIFGIVMLVSLIVLHLTYITFTYHPTSNCLLQSSNYNYSNSNIDNLHNVNFDSSFNHSSFFNSNDLIVRIYVMDDKHYNQLSKIRNRDFLVSESTRESFMISFDSDIINLNHTNNAILKLSEIPSTFLYSMERGVLILSKNSIENHNFTYKNIFLNSKSSCFGGSLISNIVFNLIGSYDLVILNWAIAAFNGTGFFYNPQTNEMFNLNYASDFFSKKGNY